MLRTNSKRAKENVMQYIRENSSYIKECAEYDGIEISNDADICKYIFDDFKRVTGNHRGNIQDAFSEYASGLPLGIFDYHYNISAVDLVGDILEETQRERERYTESDAEHLMDYLIFKIVTA